MSIPFSAMCDEFYTSTRLFLKLELALERETILHFFDSIRREFPTMRKLRRRDEGDLVLEDDAPDEDTRRWIRIEEGALRFGCYNPAHPGDARLLGERVLESAPYHLTLSDLDYDHIEVVYAFDLEYRGNHDQLVAETLYAEHPLTAFLNDERALHTIDCQPFLGVSLSDECETQAYVEIKSRTSTFEVRTGRFEPQPLTVYFTVRRYWGFGEQDSLVACYRQLCDIADEWCTDRVVPLVVNPLAQAIASRP
ncbi:MAG: hypothetical protein HUU22_10440 [Phycisphaerae bacterium]|nr:hypothetical protein [Phycisphaerae bacterium]NUQ46440.1 hypothetical protein [Phycisphaerae bacterium]